MMPRIYRLSAAPDQRRPLQYKPDQDRLVRTDTGQIVYLADYRPTDFVLERVDLTFELHPTETKVEARLIFHRREGTDRQAPLVLDGDELTLSGLLLDQVEVPAEQYEAMAESLTVRDLPESAPSS